MFGMVGPATVRSGPYANMTVEVLYNSVRFTVKRVIMPDETEEEKVLGEQLLSAREWVEAENIFAVREVIIEWFNAMNEGVANDRYPDPLNLEGPPGELITEERADEFVEALEQARFKGLGKEEGPGFPRLEPHARIAFMQAMWQVMKTDKQLRLEAKERLESEDLPEVVLKAVQPGPIWGGDFF